MIVVDIIDEFIRNLDYTLDVETVTLQENVIVSGQIVDTTTIKVKDYLFAREHLPIDVSGWTAKIVSVNFDTKEIVIEGDFTVEEEEEAKTFTLIPPMFRHGTPYIVNDELDREISYPLVYLLEILRETIPSSLDSAYETIPTIRLFFLDESSFNTWDTDAIYSNVVIPQRNFVEYVLREMRDSKLFGLPSNIEMITFARFGEYVDKKGSVSSIFNKELSGIELRMELPINKLKCN